MTTFVAAMGLVIGVSTATVAIWKGVGGEHVNTTIDKGLSVSSNLVKASREILVKASSPKDEKHKTINATNRSIYHESDTLNEFQVYLFVCEFFRLTGQIITKISPLTEISPFQLYTIVFKLISPMHAKILGESSTQRHPKQ